jgi:hypothetical protein
MVTRTPSSAFARYLAFLRPHAQRAGVEEGDRPQVGRLQLVDAHHLEAGVGQFGQCVGNREVVQLRRLVEALQMRVEPEDGRAIGGGVGLHSFEDARAVLQTVSKYVHLRLVPGDELSVEPDFLSRRESHVVLPN